jgi:hypothetical protein
MNLLLLVLLCMCNCGLIAVASTPMTLREGYATLGVVYPSDLKTVKKSYRSLSLQFHPDKNPNCLTCPHKMQALSEALDIVVRDLQSRSGFPEISDLSTESLLIIDALMDIWNRAPEIERENILTAARHYRDYGRPFHDLFKVIKLAFPHITEDIGSVFLHPVVLLVILSYNLCALIGFLWILKTCFQIIIFCYLKLKFVVYDFPIALLFTKKNE